MGNRIVEFDTVGVHSWKVPGGVHEISVGLWGAGYTAIPAGTVDPAYPVTPGQVLVFYVGGGLGFNGGGAGSIYLSALGDSSKSTGGGGATDMRIGGQRVMVAGGAGGVSLNYGPLGPGYFDFIDGGLTIYAQASMPGPEDDTRVPQRIMPGYPITKFAGWYGGTFAGARAPGEVFIDPDGPGGDDIHYVMGGGGGGYGGGGSSALFSDDEPVEADRSYLMATSRAGGSWSSHMTPSSFGDLRYHVARPDGTYTLPVVDGLVHIEYDAGKGGWHLGHVGWGRNQGW